MNKLPTWTECEAAHDDRTATALHEFIYEYEPVDADEWRTRLAALLQESYEAAAPQRGKVR
jgi:hypothetical protein